MAGSNRLTELAACQRQLENSLKAATLNRTSWEKKFADHLKVQIAGLQQRLTSALDEIKDQISTISPSSGMGNSSILELQSNFVNSPLPKLDFPRFDGMNPRAWILKCDSYFKLMPNISDAQKVDMARLHFEGKALMWFQTLPLGDLVLTWKQFLELVNSRFELNPRYLFIEEENDVDVEEADSIVAIDETIVVVTLLEMENSENRHVGAVIEDGGKEEVMDEKIEEQTEAKEDSLKGTYEKIQEDDKSKGEEKLTSRLQENVEPEPHEDVEVKKIVVTFDIDANELVAVTKLRELGNVRANWDPGVSIVVVGSSLMVGAAVTVKKVFLDLGSNGPCIIISDADLDVVVGGTLASKFWNSGHTCVCVNKILVQEGISEKFANAFSKPVESIKVGHGLTEGSIDVVPGLYSDIGKGARGLLYKDYQTDQKFTITTYWPTRVTLISYGSKNRKYKIRSFHYFATPHQPFMFKLTLQCHFSCRTELDVWFYLIVQSKDCRLMMSRIREKSRSWHSELEDLRYKYYGWVIIGAHLKKNADQKLVSNIQKEDLRKDISLMCNLTNQLESTSKKCEKFEAKISKTDFLMSNTCKTDFLILVCLIVLRKKHISDGLKCILCTFSLLDPRGRGSSSGGGIVMTHVGVIRAGEGVKKKGSMLVDDGVE